MTYASGSLTGISAYHSAFDMPIEGVSQTACPQCHRFAERGKSEAGFVISFITPWKYPIAVQAWMIVPALALWRHRRIQSGSPDARLCLAVRPTYLPARAFEPACSIWSWARARSSVTRSSKRADAPERRL